MASFTKEQELEIVREAKELTLQIGVEKKELDRMRSEAYEVPRPLPPTKKEIEPAVIELSLPEPPKVELKYTGFVKSRPPLFVALMFPVYALLIYPFLQLIPVVDTVSWVIGVPWLVAFWYGLITSIGKFDDEKERLNSELANDPEYLAKIERIKRENAELNEAERQRVARLREQYESDYAIAMGEYEREVLPKYEAGLEKWKVLHANKVMFLTRSLAENENALASLYETKKLISVHDRDLMSLTWIYDELSTSDLSYAEVVQRLDSNRQILAAGIVNQSIANMENSMRNDLHRVYSAIEMGNYEVEALNEELRRTRRDQNIAGAVTAFQLHGVNKKLKSMPGNSD